MTHIIFIFFFLKERRKRILLQAQEGCSGVQDPLQGRQAGNIYLVWQGWSLKGQTEWCFDSWFREHWHVWKAWSSTFWFSKEQKSVLTLGIVRLHVGKAPCWTWKLLTQVEPTVLILQLLAKSAPLNCFLFSDQNSQYFVELISHCWMVGFLKNLNKFQSESLCQLPTLYFHTVKGVGASLYWVLEQFI